MSTAKKRVRVPIAWLLVMLLLVASLVPSMGVQAAPATQKTVPSLRMIFSARYYADRNLDVRMAYGYNEKNLYNHFVTYGIKEGRVISPVLDLHAYKAGNLDLQRAFGDDWLLYVWHFLNYGIYENAKGQRSDAGILFNPTVFLKENPEVQQITGGDLLLTVQYYIAQGMPKGNWVNPPWIAPKTSSAVQQNFSGEEEHSPWQGDTDGDGGSHEPSKPDKPSKPEITDPPGPIDPEPVEHEHTRDSFDESGHCKVTGCEYTLAEFQADCKVDHGAIYTTKHCDVCGAAGTKVCEVDHGEILKGELCPECGVEGTKTEEPVEPEEPFVCPKADKHADLHLGVSCDGESCSYVGEVPHEFTDGKCQCGAEDPDYVPPIESECTEEDHAADRVACGATCPKCNAYVAPEHQYVPTGCLRCGAACPNADNHKNIPCGGGCEICQWTPQSTHSFVDGVCERCGYVCPHSYCKGKCDWCGATTFYCTNAFHQNCPPKDPTVMCPDCGQPAGTEHAYIGGNGPCVDCGACPGDKVYGEHQYGEDGMCVICGAKGEVVAYTPENCPGHEYNDNNVCVKCGSVKNVEASGGAEETTTGGDGEDGAESTGDVEGVTGLPDALVPDAVDGVMDVTDDAEDEEGEESDGDKENTTADAAQSTT